MYEGHGNENVFTWAAPPLKFGVGAVDEIGAEVAAIGAGSCLVITDSGVRDTGVPDRIHAQLVAAGIKAEVFDRVAIEPTDKSIDEAVAWAREQDWDCFIAVGGGSAMDTAKAVNLLTTHPGELLDFVTPPIGAGKAPVAAASNPSSRCPTTAGTGSESTTICVVDFLGLHLKAGVSHPKLRPTLAVVDPLTTVTLPVAGDRGQRHGRALARARELHQRAFRRQARPRGPDEAARVLRIEPDQRRLVRAGTRPRRAVPAARGDERPRPRRPLPHGAGVHRLPEPGSATQAPTCHTPTPIRWRAPSRTTGPRATRRCRWCRTVRPCRATAAAVFRWTYPGDPGAAPARRRAAQRADLHQDRRSRRAGPRAQRADGRHRHARGPAHLRLRRVASRRTGGRNHEADPPARRGAATGDAQTR